MPTDFEIIKEQVDIVDVARSYGVEIVRNNKAHCPWHTDKTPSMSFKSNRFTCFSCGESGDVIDLVRILTNHTPYDVLREINESYHIGLDLDAPTPTEVIQHRNEIKEQRERFVQWEQNSFLILNSCFHTLREWKDTLFPKNPDDIPDPRYAEALHRLDFIEFVLDTVYICGNREEKAKFIISHESMIRNIEQRLIWEGISYAGRNGTGAQTAARFRPVIIMGGSELRSAA